MNKKSVGSKDATDKLVKNIRRRASRNYSAEEKIRIVFGWITRRGKYRRPVEVKVLRKAVISLGQRNSLKLGRTGRRGT